MQNMEKKKFNSTRNNCIKHFFSVWNILYESSLSQVSPTNMLLLFFFSKEVYRVNRNLLKPTYFLIIQGNVCSLFFWTPNIVNKQKTNRNCIKKITTADMNPQIFTEASKLTFFLRPPVWYASSFVLIIQLRLSPMQTSNLASSLHIIEFQLCWDQNLCVIVSTKDDFSSASFLHFLLWFVFVYWMFHSNFFMHIFMLKCFVFFYIQFF